MSRRDADKALEERLEASRMRLVAETDRARLLTTLRNELPDLSDNLYVVDSIPDDVVDIYAVLVDGETVVRAEIPRHAAEPGTVVATMPLDEYRNRHPLTRLARRTIDAAVRLAWARREDDAR